MKVQNNPSGAPRHLPLHKGGFDSRETKNRFTDKLLYTLHRVYIIYTNIIYHNIGAFAML